jgi:hypothetical protein
LLTLGFIDSYYSVSTTAIGDCHAALQADGVGPDHLDRDVFAYYATRPRVILVEDHGVLCGLVTVKDVLKYTLTEAGEVRSRWDETQFEGIVEEAWTWMTTRINIFLSWCRRFLRR